MESFRKNTHGMVWRFQTGIDLTDYTELVIDFRSAVTGTVITKSSAALEVTDTGTPDDGYAVFTVPAGMLTETGTWQAVPNPKFTGKSFKPSTVHKFEVLEDFEPVQAS